MNTLTVTHRALLGADTVFGSPYLLIHILTITLSHMLVYARFTSRELETLELS